MPNYTPPPQAPMAPPTGVRPVNQNPLPPRNPNGSGFPDPGNMGSLEYANQVAAAPGKSGEAQVRHTSAPAPGSNGLIAKIRQHIVNKRAAGASPTTGMTPGAKAIIDARMQTGRK